METGIKRAARILLLTTASFAAAASAHAQTGDLRAFGNGPAALPVLDGDEPARTAATSGPGARTAVPLLIAGGADGAATAESVVDPGGTNGVGQMVKYFDQDHAGSCTATLFNPRTVIFAAHCVNRDAADSEYIDPSILGNSGQVPVAFAFQADNRPAFRQWLGREDANKAFQTDTALGLYNASYVTYNPAVRDAPQNALQGDVALAALDTPAVDIPTWALLFSPLTGPTHIAITGYGRNGVGSVGIYDDGGIDFRRRSAENMLGAYLSSGFGYSGNPSSVKNPVAGTTANEKFSDAGVYWVSFSDPNYGTTDAFSLLKYIYGYNMSPELRAAVGTVYDYDHNILQEQYITANEGGTAPGDSGGPMIVDQLFDQPVVAGVLSAGIPTAVAPVLLASLPGTPGKFTYGWNFFYQPLSEYWQWIVANSPYKYTSALPGDGEWTDPAHWRLDIDPNFRIAGADGSLINALPGTAEIGTASAGDAQWGTSCGLTWIPTLQRCVNIKQYMLLIASGQDPETAWTNAMMLPKAQEPLELFPGTTDEMRAAAIGTGELGTDPLPDPTFENGLPGATGFVPIDDDGDPTAGRPARYFDVTLSAEGTTTLDVSAAIDRLTIAGTKSALDITEEGSLVTYIDTTLVGGNLNVDGSYASVGDISLLSGMLSGKGMIRAPYVTSVMGIISPGQPGTIGTLTVQGNVVMSSGTLFVADIGANGSSDTLAVQIDPIAGGGGNVSVGGTLGVAPVQGHRPRFGDSYTIISAEGEVSGMFAMVSGLTGVLRPMAGYSEHDVTLKIDAASYFTEVNAASPIQSAFATLLDRNRVNYSQLPTLYGDLDVLPAAQVQGILEQAAPYALNTRQSLARMQGGALAELHRDRLLRLRSREGQGQLTVIGQPLRLAELALEPVPGTVQARDDGAETIVPTVKLPDNISAYLAAGYLDGSSVPLDNLIVAGRSESLNGWYLSGGVEVATGSNLSWGGALSYSEAKGDTLGGRARSQYLEAALYLSYASDKGLVASATGTIANLDTRTRRTAYSTGGDYMLRSKSSTPVYGIEGTVGYAIGRQGLKLVPAAGLRASWFTLDPVIEHGGDFALNVTGQKNSSVEGRAGLSVEGETRLSGGARLSPRIGANFVHGFDQKQGLLAADFAGGLGQRLAFLAPTRDRNWAELGGGIGFESANVSIDLRASAVLGRDDLQYQTYRASAKIRF